MILDGRKTTFWITIFLVSLDIVKMRNSTKYPETRIFVNLQRINCKIHLNMTDVT